MKLEGKNYNGIVKKLYYNKNKINFKLSVNHYKKDQNLKIRLVEY